jgi:hypothetical protein
MLALLVEHNRANQEMALRTVKAFGIDAQVVADGAQALFDAGTGDATVLSRIMRSAHRVFPAVPLLAALKTELGRDVRLAFHMLGLFWLISAITLRSQTSFGLLWKRRCQTCFICIGAIGNGASCSVIG